VVRAGSDHARRQHVFLEVLDQDIEVVSDVRECHRTTPNDLAIGWKPTVRFAVVSAAVLGLVVSGATNGTIAKPARTVPAATSSPDLKSAMRKLWEDHTT